MIKECAICHKPMETKRCTKRFCSDACRQRSNREPDAKQVIADAEHDARAAINRILWHDGGLDHRRAQNALKSLVMYAATYLSPEHQADIAKQLNDVSHDYQISIALQRSVTIDRQEP